MGASKAAEARQYCILICLALKDLGWVALSAGVAFPAAFGAFVLGAHSLVLSWKSASTGHRVHSVAELCWLIGNSVWMCGELFWEKAGGEARQMPWYRGPLLGARTDAADESTLLCQVFFVSGLSILSMYYVLCAVGYASWDDGHAPLEGERSNRIFGVIPLDIYAHMFMCPWICKDLAWTFEAKVPLAIFAVLTLSMALDHLRRIGGQVMTAELLWIVGNVIWAYGEVWDADKHQYYRSSAALVLSLASALLLEVTFRFWRTKVVENEQLLDRKAKLPEYTKSLQTSDDLL